MDANRRLEFWLLVIVLGTFCIGTIALIIAKCMNVSIDPAIPLVDSTLGTLVMAMWKDFSHSNSDQQAIQSQEVIKPTITEVTK